jgi:dUTP pyrophosphatase
MKDLHDFLFGDIMPLQRDVEFVTLHPEAKQPTRAHEFDAGNDLYALEDVTIYPGCIGKIRTGVAVSIPQNMQGIIKDRSSMGSKGLHVFSGVIDHGYTGEISVVLHNSNDWLTPHSIFTVLGEAFSNWKKWFLNIDNLRYDILALLERDYEKKAYHVKKGDKIAQLIVSPLTVVTWKKQDTLSPGERGDKGFGSSGK